MKELNQEPAPSIDSQESIPMPTAEDVAFRGDAHKSWINMSHDEMLEAQKNEVLMGWNPDKGLGLVKIKETRKK